MATKAVSAATMAIGKKGGGKHWTADQVAARQQAAASLTRKKTELIAPGWLNSGALFEWGQIIHNAEQVELLDDLDAGPLGVYCSAMDHYQTIEKSIANGEQQTDDAMKLLQGWARIIATYADKLGFTPQARARLIKKRADENKPDKFGKQFD